MFEGSRENTLAEKFGQVALPKHTHFKKWHDRLNFSPKPSLWFQLATYRRKNLPWVVLKSQTNQDFPLLFRAQLCWLVYCNPLSWTTGEEEWNSYSWIPKSCMYMKEGKEIFFLYLTGSLRLEKQTDLPKNFFRTAPPAHIYADHMRWTRFEGPKVRKIHVFGSLMSEIVFRRHSAQILSFD